MSLANNILKNLSEGAFSEVDTIAQELFSRYYDEEENKFTKDLSLIIADRWYPSSKLCNCCGAIKKDLKLSDKIYKCDCGYIADRDYNASLNLRDAITYKIA